MSNVKNVCLRMEGLVKVKLDEQIKIKRQEAVYAL